MERSTNQGRFFCSHCFDWRVDNDLDNLSNNSIFFTFAGTLIGNCFPTDTKTFFEIGIDLSTWSIMEPTQPITSLITTRLELVINRTYKCIHAFYKSHFSLLNQKRKKNTQISVLQKI